MTSNIDPLIPVTGTPALAAPLQANFEAAHDEIEALQSDVLALQSASPGGLTEVPATPSGATYGRRAGGTWQIVPYLQPDGAIEGLTAKGFFDFLGGSFFQANCNGYRFEATGDSFEIAAHNAGLVLDGSTFTCNGSVFNIRTPGSSNPVRIFNGGRGLEVDGQMVTTGASSSGGLPIAGGTITGNLRVNNALNIGTLWPNEVTIGYGHVYCNSFQCAGTAFNINSDGSLYLQGNGGTPVDMHVNMNPQFWYGLKVSNGNLNVDYGNLTLAGYGTTAPTAVGNLNITSTNPVWNGRLNTTGNINMTGNNTQLMMNGNNQSFYMYGANPAFQTGYLAAYGNGVGVVNYNTSWGPISPYGNVWGWYMRLGGTEPIALNIPDTEGWQGAMSIQYTGGSLCVFPTGGGNHYTSGSQFYTGNGGDGQPHRKMVSFSAPNESAFNGTQLWFTCHQRARKPNGGAWEVLSDSRTKTNVQDYTHGLPELVKLNPITFRYNGRGRMLETGVSHVGLAAEEAQDVMPEIVGKMRGKLDYDSEESDLLMLDASALPFAIINALKEISRRLEALEAKIG